MLTYIKKLSAITKKYILSLTGVQGAKLIEILSSLHLFIFLLFVYISV